MSDNPESVQWREPNLSFDAESDMIHLNLGVVHLPPHIDPENTERVLAVVTELVNQMIEDDILPSILCPDNVPAYEEEEKFTPDMEAVAFEDDFRETFDDDEY